MTDHATDSRDKENILPNAEMPLIRFDADKAFESQSQLSAMTNLHDFAGPVVRVEWTEVTVRGARAG